MNFAEAPLPPVPLMLRVGANRTDTEADYLRVGEIERGAVLARIPSDWDLASCRVLDFGCGAGSALRHFGPEIARGMELWGCDIHGPSVAWVRHNLPGVHVFENEETPSLDIEDGYFDVVYSVSVFTHITEHWADWLLELHRVLRPNGLLIASLLGRTMYERLLGKPYHEGAVGMEVVGPDAPWDDGGPMVFHSPSWIERHWARAFEILSLERDVLRRDGDDAGHDIVVGRRTPTRPERETMVVADAAPNRP